MNRGNFYLLGTLRDKIYKMYSKNHCTIDNLRQKEVKKGFQMQCLPCEPLSYKTMHGKIVWLILLQSWLGTSNFLKNGSHTLPKING